MNGDDVFAFSTVLAIVVSDFRSFTGCFAVGSLVVLPIWLFALHKGLLVYPIPLLVQHSITLTLIVGRSFCAFVEVCVRVIFCCYFLLPGILRNTFPVVRFYILFHCKSIWTCFHGDKQCWIFLQKNFLDAAFSDR